MPADPRRRGEVIEWLFAALNSVEAASLPWSIFAFSGDTTEIPGTAASGGIPASPAQAHEAVLAAREWLAGPFSIADILMADVLRLIDRFGGLATYPACDDYVAHATARPTFIKAHADQMTHFAAAG